MSIERLGIGHGFNRANDVQPHQCVPVVPGFQAGLQPGGGIETGHYVPIQDNSGSQFEDTDIVLTQQRSKGGDVSESHGQPVAGLTAMRMPVPARREIIGRDRADSV